MSNRVKWILILFLGVLAGLGDAATDENAKLKDYVRHALIGAGLTATALKINLQKEISNLSLTQEAPEKSRGAAAGE